MIIEIAMERTMVIGSGGAGKTTLAREIAVATGLPLVHLDRLFWKPGWVRTPTDEWHRLVEKLVAADRWVIDGNYGGTMDLRLAAADTVVFLDVSRLRCLARIVTRAFRNRERLTWEFVRWVWSYSAVQRPRILTKLEGFEADGGRVVTLRNEREIRQFLSTIARPREGPEPRA
jgi:adenylate kinase family enzyme